MLSTLYGLVATVLTAAQSAPFRADLAEAGATIWGGVCQYAGAVQQWSQDAAALPGGGIPGTVLLWLVRALGVVAPLAALGGGIFGVVWLYRQYAADVWSVVAALTALALAVWGAGLIGELIPVNLVLLVLLTQAVYLAWRVYKGRRW